MQSSSTHSNLPPQSISRLLLTASVVSSCRTMDGKSEVPFTMDMFEQFLFSMNNSVVFANIGIGIVKNVINGYILDNGPLKSTLEAQLDRMGFRKMSDLYIPTCLSVVESGTGLTFRVCSDDPAVADVAIIDVIMASTAMPVVFQMGSIPHFSPPLVNNTNLYIDGCSGTDMIPLIPHLTRWNVSVVYAITKQNEIGTRASQSR
jgi:predicted acylesterase/phospholipase RssA